MPAEGRLLKSVINTNNSFNWKNCNLKNLPPKDSEIGNDTSRGLCYQKAVTKDFLMWFLWVLDS